MQRRPALLRQQPPRGATPRGGHTGEPSCAQASAGWGACSTQRHAANMLAQGGAAELAGLSLPATLLKRTRCDSPGAADAQAPDGAGGCEEEDDEGAPAVDHVLSGLDSCGGAAAAQQAASPPLGGKSPPRGANKSPRWRAHGAAASSPLGEAARGVQSGRGADTLAPPAASLASGADASQPPDARATAGGGTEQDDEQRCVKKAAHAHH